MFVEFVKYTILKLSLITIKFLNNKKKRKKKVIYYKKKKIPQFVFVRMSLQLAT